ncbi:AAA family ATPase [Blastomonas sp.]|uniref:AAA family ATPase n=1 Tax=Blastomonas sp. TaxID=1909299 RepID=UPI00406A66F0
MKAAPIWLLWKAVEKPDRPKPDKVPYYANGMARHGVLDGPEDRAQLVSYELAVRVFAGGAGGYAGLAVALGPDGRGGCWQGIDFDHVRRNQLADLANAVPGYVEFSPSGDGAHAIGYGRPFVSMGSNGSGLEAYAGGRYFTFTGSVIRDADPVCLVSFIEHSVRPRHGLLRAARATTAEDHVSVDGKTVAELRSALCHMRADDYDTWYRMGLALKELGDTGRGLWLDWSTTSAKFDMAQAAAKWEGFAPRSTGHQAVFGEAQRHGWTNPREAERLAHGSQVAEGLLRRMESQQSADSSGTGRTLSIRSLGDVEIRAIEWLWTGWIPKGYITIFAGESGAGKSTVLADVAARITTGAPWPGDDEWARREPERVLWLGSEDSIEEMTVPRLMACGAACERVFQIEGVTENGKRSTFSMQDDLANVSRHLDAARRDGHPIAMLVIDPVTSYLPGKTLRKVDLNDAGQLRSILEPWLNLAQQHNIAIVCVTHFAKDATRPMLHRVIGSQAFAATCRSLCAVVEPPTTDDDDEPDPFERALLQVKSNLPDHPGGAWRFVTERVEVGHDRTSGMPIFATKPDWGELDNALTAKTAVGSKRGPKSQRAPAFAMWVQAQFANMPAEHWEMAEHVKLAAINAKVASESWWNKHSPEYLEKRNFDGHWKCRPRANHSQQCGKTG